MLPRPCLPCYVAWTHPYFNLPLHLDNVYTIQLWSSHSECSVRVPVADLVFHCEAWRSHSSVCRGTVSKDLRVHAAFNMETLKFVEAAAGRRQTLRNSAIGVGRQNTHVQGTAELTGQYVSNGRFPNFSRYLLLIIPRLSLIESHGCYIATYGVDRIDPSKFSGSLAWSCDCSASFIPLSLETPLLLT